MIWNGIRTRNGVMERHRAKLLEMGARSLKMGTKLLEMGGGEIEGDKGKEAEAGGEVPGDWLRIVNATTHRWLLLLISSYYSLSVTTTHGPGECGITFKKCL